MPSLLSRSRAGKEVSVDDLSAMLAAGQPLDSRKERLISRKILHLLTQHRAGGSGVPDGEREALVLQGAQLLQEYSLVASPESMALFLQPVLDLCQPSLTVNRDGVQSSRRISKRLCAWLCSHVGGAVESASHGPETYCPPSACDRSSSDDECDDINLRISRENSEKNRVVAAGGAQAAADAAAARLRGLRLLARLVSSGVDLTPTVIVDIVSTLFKDLALPPPAVSGKRGSSIELHPSASETLTTPGQRDSPPRPALSSSSKLGCSYGAWRVLTALAARPPLRLALLAAVVRYWHLHGFDAQRHGLAVRVFVFIGECAGTDGARDGARTLISYLQHISSGCTKSFDSPCGRADACADALATAGVRSNCSTLLQHLLLMTSCLGLLAELLGGDAPADADDAAGLALERDAQGLLAVVYFVVSQARVGRIPDSELSLPGAAGALLRPQQGHPSSSAAAAAASTAMASETPEEGNMWNRSASAELLLQRLWACAALLSRRSSPSRGSAQCRVLLSALRFLRAAEDVLCGGGEEVGGLLVALRVYLLHTANVLLSNHPRGGSRGGESSIPLDDESACQLGLLLQSQDLSVVRQTAALADCLLRLRPPQGLAGAPAPDEWWPLSELQLGLLADCLFNCLCRRADHHALITAAVWQVQRALLSAYGVSAVSASLPSVLALETFWCLLAQSRALGKQGGCGFAADPSAACDDDMDEDSSTGSGEQEEDTAEWLRGLRLYFACFFLRVAGRWELPLLREHVLLLLEHWRGSGLLPRSLALDVADEGAELRAADAAAVAALARASPRSAGAAVAEGRDHLLSKFCFPSNSCRDRAELAAAASRARRGAYSPCPDPYTRLAVPDGV